jgi:AraC family transcriptional regulator, ethanolamine operon transcriptional activator
MTIRNVQADPPTVQSSATAGPFRPDLQVVFSCRDPDEMSARIKYWGLEQSQLGQGPFQGAIRGTHSARIQLGCSFRSPGLLIQGVIPAETVVLSSIVRQTSPIMINGYKVAADQMIWAKAGCELDFRTLGANELITAAVHAPLFHKMALAVLGPGFFDRKPADRLALRGPESRHDVGARLRNLVEQDLAQPGRLSDPEYASAWEHQVLDTWLAEVIAPDSGASLPVRCRAARQAESFLREHRDRPVSVCELCMVSGVPKRTLMLGFRDLFGLSPAAYHRRMRLNAARRDLVRARPGETTVTVAALRWGFGHFGRFSVDYRRMFGESPIATLRS